MKLFLTSVASKTLDKIVPLLPKPPKELKVAFIPTAGDTYKEKPWMEEDREKLVDLGFNVADFDLKGKTESQIEKALSKVDIIFVAGGNTFYLLEKTKQSGFDKVVKKLVKNGTIYVGSSAGSILAGPNIEPVKILDDPQKARLDSFEGLGLVDFVILPHYGKEKYKIDKIIKEYGNKYQLIPITDDQLVVAEDDRFYKL